MLVYPRTLLEPSLAQSALPDAPVIPVSPAKGSRSAALRNAVIAWRLTRAGDAAGAHIHRVVPVGC